MYMWKTKCGMPNNVREQQVCVRGRVVGGGFCIRWFDRNAGGLTKEVSSMAESNVGIILINTRTGEPLQHFD